MVTAFDLSHGYLDEACRRAAANQVSVHFVRADGERLPFADGSFDRVWGNAILHHLDLKVAASELARVLCPDGWAVFCEPWGENPLLNWARQRLPYPGKQRTPDEQPLQRQHLQYLRQVFSRVDVRGYQLVSMARRVLPRGRLVKGLDWCDDLLLQRVPALQRFCRYVVLMLRRKSL
jgi:ubiquinone/menaquinone biosynthesis C-methylase UbiE